MFRSLSLIRARASALVAHLPVASLSRALATKAGGLVKAPKAPEGLSSFLEREIAFEKEDESAVASLEKLRESLAADWTLNEAPGLARFSLAKTFRDQKVSVDVDISPMASEDEDYPEGEDGAEPEEEPEPPADGYRMIVTVQGKGKAMQFGCFVTNELRIHRVTVHDASKTPTAESIFAGVETPEYTGPNFEELDEALQNGFYEYLSARCVFPATRAICASERPSPPPLFTPRTAPTHYFAVASMTPCARALQTSPRLKSRQNTCAGSRTRETLQSSRLYLL